MSLTANFERGTSGATIAASDPGGHNAWDNVFISANSTFAYDTAQAAHETKSAKTVSGGVSPTIAYTAWTTAFGTQTDHYGRLYLRLNNNFATSPFLTFLSGASQSCRLLLNASNQISVRDSADVQQAVATTAMNLNQWYRIEWHVINSTTVGQVVVRLYASMDSDTITETISTAPSINTLASCNEVRFGLQSNEVNFTFWMDDIVAAATSWPGPVVPTVILFDSASSSGYEASLSTYSWSHTCSGNYRGLLVSVSVLATGTVSSVTYAGTNLSFVRSDINGVYRNEIWKLENPALGSNSVVVNLSASLTSIASAVSYTGVDQTDMIDAQTGANGSGGTPTANLTNITDKSWIFSGISTADTTTSTPQVERANNTGALGSGAVSDIDKITPPESIAMSWAAVGVTDSWALSLVSIKPDPAALSGSKDPIRVFIGPF